MGAINCVSLPQSSNTPSQQTKVVTDESLECTLYATQGARKQMEDKHVTALSLPNHPSYSLFGVFDGFNGDDASTYFAEHIIDALDAVTDLADNDAIIQSVGEMDKKYLNRTEDTEKYNANAGCTFVFAVINTFIYDVNDNDMSTPDRADTLHTVYSNSISSSFSSKSELGTESLKYGSFADEFPSLSDDGKRFRIRVFWAGDARAVLMSDSCQFQRLTTDHHCSVAKEAERIVNAKGTITNNRVNGICEVTRCFGCRAMKDDASLPSDKQKMISVPDQTTVTCGVNDRLLIFCDGLVKPWTDKQFNVRCTHHVMQHKDEKEGELNALMYLCEQAMDEGSRDNISVLSIKFK